MKRGAIEVPLNETCRRRAPALALAFALAGCGEAPGGADDVPTWTLPPDPRLQIGALDGPPEQQLHEVYDATQLPDGRVVVVNSGTSELRVYGADGDHLRSLGREGEGPGEFRAVVGVWRLGGDTLLAWDVRLRRVSLFTVTGGHVGDARLEGDLSIPYMVGVLEDRTLLVAQDEPFEPRDELSTMQLQLLRYDLQGRLLDSLGRHPSRLVGPFETPGRWGMPAFSAYTVHAIDPRGYWIGHADAYEVTRYDPSGALEIAVRWEGPDRTVREEHRARHRDAGHAQDGQPFADRFAAYSQLLVDADSRLWVRLFRPRYESGPHRWLVFDPEGRLVVRAETPARLEIHEIGEGYVLGVFTDELGVEWVRVYDGPRERG